MNGQRGFEVIRGHAEVVSAEGREGSAALKLLPSRPSGIVQLSINAGFDAADSPDKIIYTEFHIRPAAAEAGDSLADVEGSLTGFFKVDDAGELHIYDGGTEDAPGQWLPTGTRFALNDAGSAQDWIRLSFRQDFEAGLWDVAINGDIFRANLAMERQVVSLEKIEFIGQSRLPLWIDDIHVSRHATAYTDQDRDGLPDDWEMTFGLPISEGRDGDADQDGLTNVEELVLSTDPMVSDTDGDGRHDGDEYLAGANPLENDEAEIAATAVASNGIMLYSTSCDGDSAAFQVGYYGSSGVTVDWISDGDAAILYPTFKFLDFSHSASGPYVTVDKDDLLVWGESFRVGFMAELSDGQSLMGMFDVTCECDCGCTSITAVNSVDITIGIGKLNFGKYGQNLVVKEPSWTERLYTRASLHYAGDHREGRAAHSIQEIDGREVAVIDWIKTDTQFTRLRDIDHGYMIEAYHLNQVDENHEVSGEPFKRQVIENPDPNGIEPYHRLLIREEGGRPSYREYRFRVVNGAEEWELFEGGRNYLIEPIRYQKVSKPKERRYTFTGSTLSTEFRQQGRWDPARQRLVMDEEKQLTYRSYPTLGRYLVKEVLDPRGQALTTEWGYLERIDAVDFEDNLANFALLDPQWESRANGSWTWFGYDQQARRNRIVEPIGNTPRPLEMPLGLEGFHVTTIDYDRSGQNKTTRVWRDGHLEKTTRENRRVENRLLRRELTEIFGDSETSERTLILSDKHGLVHQENPDGTVITIDRQFDGDLRTESRFSGAPDGSYGTETMTVTHRSGLITEERVTDLSSGTVTKHEETLEHDAAFRPLLTADQVTGKVSSKGYDCCELEWTTGINGATKMYERDVLGRIVGQLQGFKDPIDKGNTLSATVSTKQFQLDSFGRRLSTQQGDVKSSTAYNLGGQRTSKHELSGVLKAYKTIMLENGGRLELTSLPRSGNDDRHRITSMEYTAEGKLRRSRTYASKDPFATMPDSGTTIAHTLYEEGRDDKGRYTQSTRIANLFDRRITRTYVDEQGQQVEIIRAYGTQLAARETFDYSDEGQLIRHIDPDGVTTRYSYDEKGERTITAIDLNIEPSEAPDHIDYQVDRITRRVVKFSEIERHSGSLPVRRTTTEVFTEAGPRIISMSEQALDGTYSAVIQDGQTATEQRVEGKLPGEWQIIRTRSDQSYRIQTYRGGRLGLTSRHDADGKVISWTSYEADERGRPWKTTDSRTGTTTRYYDDDGRVWKVSAPNPQTRSSTEGTLDTIYHYDALGQLVSTTKPSGGILHQVYNANGALREMYGHNTIDVEYRYNGFGEKTGIITFYGPENKPARTRWHYNSHGNLAFKQDAAGKRVYYTYTPGGRPKTRTWARGVKTNYHYDGAGQLIHIGYSDTTPDVHYTYTRLGQQHTVRDAGGLITYTYRQNNLLELESETRSAGLSRRLSGASRQGQRQRGSVARKQIRQHATATVSTPQHLYGEPKTLTYAYDDYGRSAGFTIGSREKQTKDYEVRYLYDSVGRLEAVGSQGYWFHYDYEPNSTTDLVKTISARFVKKTEFEFESGRDTIASVTNNVGINTDQLLSRYAYDYGPDGHRVSRTTKQGGQEFTDTFRFDADTGGVINSTRDGVRAVEDYQYDKIGNRLSAKNRDALRLYQPTKLSQYEEIIDNEVIHPTHDADGNLMQRGHHTFTWDGENRLTEIRERGSLVATYTYDYQGRRIARRVPSLKVDERYIYDGWNLISVHNAGDIEPEESYTWGKDLSGSIQGAGGVGGLLFARKRTAEEDAWIYHYDANGNVTELTSNAILLDGYRYDTFGNIQTVPDIDNRYRFSTKVQDTETGHYYYGYRSYDPKDGRWLSSDPIGEYGGINLYAFVENRPIDGIDALGLAPDYSGFGWNAWNKAYTLARWNTLHSNRNLMVETVDQWLTKAESLCDLCEYKSHLVGALTELLSNIEEIRDHLQNNVNTPVKLADLGAGVGALHFDGFFGGWYISFNYVAPDNFFADTTRVETDFLHELSHEYGTDHGGSPAGPGNDAHVIDDLLHAPNVAASELYTWSLRESGTTKVNCPDWIGQNAPKSEQWPNNAED